MRADLLWKSLLLARDKKHVVEQNNEHLRSFSRVKKLQRPLHKDLPGKGSFGQEHEQKKKQKMTGRPGQTRPLT